MSIKVNQFDTIATEGGIDSDDTSLTLTTGSFDNKTSGDKVPLIIDYDNSAKMESILAYINGTAVTSIERAQDGTSAAAHSQGAKVCIGSAASVWKYWLRNDYIGIGARAYLSVDQDNITNATWTKVELDTKEYDLGNDFASNKFTVPAGGDGKYLVTGSVFFEGTDLLADKSLAVGVYKNGTIARQFQDASVVASSGKSIQFATIIDLDATDYLELYCYHGNGNNNVDLDSGNAFTNMAVHFLGK